MKNVIFTGMLLPLLFVACRAEARDNDRHISEKRALRSNGTISVGNISGSVRIVGSDQEMMILEGEIEDGVDKVDISGDEDSLRVRVETHRNSRGNADADLTLRVPRNARIEVRCVSCDVELRDATGVADLETVSGEITIGGELKTIELKSVSGDIRVDGVGERLVARSVSGDVEVRSAIGEVELETVSGDMRIAGGNVTRFRAKSVSGEVELRGNITGRGNSDIESHSGDVTLELGDKTDASFEVHTFSGQIEGKGGDSKKRDRFTIGSGSARVSIRTFSGDVRLRTP